MRRAPANAPPSNELATRTLASPTGNRDDALHQVVGDALAKRTGPHAAAQFATEQTPPDLKPAKTEPLEFGYWMIPSINPKWVSLLQRADVRDRMSSSFHRRSKRARPEDETSVCGPSFGLTWQAAVLSRDPLAIDKITHEELSRSHRVRHEAGDDNAIFDYAQTDRWAWKAPWVVSTLAHWQAQDLRDKLERFMAAYARNKAPQAATAPRSRAKIVELIARDQTIFAEILRLRRPGQSIQDVCGQVTETARFHSTQGAPVSDKTVARIYDRYWPFYEAGVKYRFFTDLSTAPGD